HRLGLPPNLPETDRQEKSGPVRLAPEGRVVRGAVRLDHGRNCQGGREEKQLHLLRRVSPPGARPRRRPSRRRPHCDRPQRGRHSGNRSYEQCVQPRGLTFLRGDIARLQRCTDIVTPGDGALPRSKPFKYAYEKEIVMYAYFKKLDYFSTECVYSPDAYRGHARTFLKNLESVRPSAIIDIIHSGEAFHVKGEVKLPSQTTCTRCGYISSNPVCKACMLLDGLNRGLPAMGVGHAKKARRLAAAKEAAGKAV
ncbi:MAG: hypothetical protein BJ554DRAFT_5700, partial [Olpidium bornovanus]